MLSTLQEIARQLQNSRVGKRVVYCSGTFDILHRGHVYFLMQAKSKGDILVVGVNCNKSVSDRKGPTRPIMPEEDRAFIVSALSSVDFVFIKEENVNKEEIIVAFSPDIIVFNNDTDRSEKHFERYRSLEEKFPDVKFVYALDAKKDERWSTTKLIEKIKNCT